MVRGVWFTTAEIGTKKKSIICCNCQTWVFEISQEHSPPSDPPPPAFGTLLRSTGNVGGGKILCVTLYDSCSAQYLVLRSTLPTYSCHNFWELGPIRELELPSPQACSHGSQPRGARVPGCLGAWVPGCLPSGTLSQEFPILWFPSRSTASGRPHWPLRGHCTTAYRRVKRQAPSPDSGRSRTTRAARPLSDRWNVAPVPSTAQSGGTDAASGLHAAVTEIATKR